MWACQNDAPEQTALTQCVIKKLCDMPQWANPVC